MSRRPTTADDLKDCLHKEIFLAADDAEALKLAVEYLCEYASKDPEDVADTPEEIWDYFNDDWGYGDPIPMVLKQGRRVVKDSGFDPGEGVEESVSGAPAKTESKGIEQVRKELNDIADLWVGNDYGDDKARALADACTAVEGTEWEDAACSILKDSDMMERLTVAEAIELILSELPEV